MEGTVRRCAAAVALMLVATACAPSPPPAVVVERVTTENEASCAFLSNGTVKCWGRNESGRLGVGVGPEVRDVTVPRLVKDGARFTDVAIPYGFGCGLEPGGAVRCWSNSGDTVLAGLPRVVAITAGEEHVCAAAADGSVWCFGQNDLGQFGTAPTPRTTPPDLTPIRVPGVAGAVAVDAGSWHTCALTGTGEVWCWGANNVGQVGNGTYGSATSNRPEPGDAAAATQVQGIPGPVRSISSGFLNSCAVGGDQGVYC